MTVWKVKFRHPMNPDREIVEELYYKEERTVKEMSDDLWKRYGSRAEIWIQPIG